MTASDSRKDYPATHPRRENGQGEHEGVPHDPKEFVPLNPAKQGDERPLNDPPKPSGSGRDPRRADPAD